MAKIHESVASGNVLEVENNQVKVLSVTTKGELVDRSGVAKIVPNPDAKTIVDGSPTGLFSLTLGASEVQGGSLLFLVEARDATNTQVVSGIATYSAVATSAGTVTGTIVYVAANEAKTLSSGTLTLAFTANVSGSVITYRVQPTGSLTETVYNIRYTLLPIKGQPTIL